MSIHYALTDCPLRVVFNLPQSKCGYTYPNIYIEAKLGERYLNVDCYLGVAFNMKEKDFEDWWSDADPKTTSEACELSGIAEDVFRNLIHEVCPIVEWAKGGSAG